MKKLITILLFTVISSPIMANTDVWKFKVYLDDQNIGQHEFVINRLANSQIVRSEASYKVKFLFFTAYQYRHVSEETWKNNCLSSITARTDTNGEKQFVKGGIGTNKMKLTTNSGEQSLPSCVKTFAYWDARILTAKRLLNSQTGEYVPVEVEFVGSATTDVNGTMVPSLHYRLRLPKTTIDLWYSQDSKRWIGLSSVLENGSTLSYRLQAPGAIL